MKHSDREANDMHEHPASVKVADTPAVSKDGSEANMVRSRVSDAAAVSKDGAEVDLSRRRILGGAAFLGVGKVVGLPFKLGGEFSRAVSPVSPFAAFDQPGLRWIPAGGPAKAWADFNSVTGTGRRMVEAARKAMTDSDYSAMVETGHSTALDTKAAGINSAEKLTGSSVHSVEVVDLGTTQPGARNFSGDRTPVSDAIDLIRANEHAPLMHPNELDHTHSKLISVGETEPKQTESLLPNRQSSEVTPALSPADTMAGVHVEATPKPATSSASLSALLKRPPEGETATSSSGGFLSRWSARKRGQIEGGR